MEGVKKMNLKNIVLSLVFTLLLYFIYANRYALDQVEFLAVFFGLLIAGGLYASREWLSQEEIKTDERTKLIAGKAARVTLVASVVFIIVILAVLTYTGRPTSANGALALLLGVMSFVYSAVYAYLEKS